MTNALHARGTAPDGPRGTRRPCSSGARTAPTTPTGRAAVRSILTGVAAHRPDLDVREAFVDVQEPAVADVVDARPRQRRRRSPSSYRCCCPSASTSRSTSPRPSTSPAPPRRHHSGPTAARRHPRGPAGRPPGSPTDDSVVLAAAGSTDPAAALAVESIAAGLADRLEQPVTIGYGAGAEPRVPAAVAGARADARPGGRVVVASYLLAPGYFYDRVHGGRGRRGRRPARPRRAAGRRSSSTGTTPPPERRSCT